MSTPRILRFVVGASVYVIDSESGPLNHLNRHDGVRIGPGDEIERRRLPVAASDPGKVASRRAVQVNCGG